MPKYVLAISFVTRSAQADVMEVGGDGARIRYWLQPVSGGWSLEADAREIAQLLAADPQQYATFGEAVASLLEVATEDALGPWIGSRLTQSPEDGPPRPDT